MHTPPTSPPMAPASIILRRFGASSAPNMVAPKDCDTLRLLLKTQLPPRDQETSFVGSHTDVRSRRVFDNGKHSSARSSGGDPSKFEFSHPFVPFRPPGSIMGLCAGKPLLRRRWERVVRPMPVLAARP